MADILWVEREEDRLNICDLMPSSMGERAGVLCSSRRRRRGFHRSLGGRGFLAFEVHHVIGYVPADQRGRIRLELGTS